MTVKRRNKYTFDKKGNHFMIILILTLHLASILFWVISDKKFKSNFLFAIITIFNTIAILLHNIGYYFNGVGLDESLIYHLVMGIEGAGVSEYIDLILQCLLIFSATCIIAFLAKRLRKLKSFTKLKYIKTLAILLMLSSIGLNPSRYFATSFYRQVITSTNSTKKIKTELTAKIERKDKVKNLIYIYLESLERTYFDEKLFPGMLKGLKEIEKDSVSFSNLHQSSFTGWTIAGMVGSQCGIPLFTPSGGNDLISFENFLPGAKCLGDILDSYNYDLTYVGGASLDFAGKGHFYKSHGFRNIKGRNELIGTIKDKKYINSWGLYDDSLILAIERELNNLSKNDKPYGLFSLTLDTHHPNGHLSESCKNIPVPAIAKNNPILLSVNCSDFLISRFIKKINENPKFNETVIVIASDHLAMKNSASFILKNGHRRNLLMILNSGHPPKIIDTFGSTLDIGTTILDLIGFTGKIGLGENLLSSNLETERRKKALLRLGELRTDFMKLWEFPKVKSLFLSRNKKSLVLNGKKYKAPILIEIDGNYNTTIRPEVSDWQLKQRIEIIEPDRNMALAAINKCPTAGENSEMCIYIKPFESKHEVIKADSYNQNSLDLMKLLNPLKYNKITII